MFTILLHTSKTMRSGHTSTNLTTPLFRSQARALATYVASLDIDVMAKTMGVSAKLANDTHARMTAWTETGGLPAIDAFSGDIYSGLQATSLTPADREYAQKSLIILSGLYGVLRPLDAVMPYRLELGYRFPDPPYDNLYTFWGDRLAREIPTYRTIINVSSAEYTKAVFRHIIGTRIITPKFLSVGPKTGEPTFVTVHAKIARGAFARWLIVNRIEDEARLAEFDDLGYGYDASRSTELEPVFVAKEFKGLGLSVRLA